jgi:hypothetical protein
MVILPFAVVLCHSLSFVDVRCRSLSFVVIRRYNRYLPQKVVVLLRGGPPDFDC